MEHHYREEHLHFEAEGYRIPAVLTMPEERVARWGIVLIPGSMGNDVDGNYPEAHMQPHTYADLARQLANRGHMVLRYARRGQGTGVELIDQQRAGEHPVFSRQRYIAEAAIHTFRTITQHEQHLTLAGHSEGSVHGVLLSQRADLHIDAFISLSGPALRYLDLFIHTAHEMAKAQGEIIDFGAFKVNAAHYIRTFELIRAGEPLTEEIKADPTMEFFVKSWDTDDPQTHEGRHYMRDYDALDPCCEIARVPCPVLIVQGGMDQSGVHADNGERLYQARAAFHPETTQLAFFPDLQHFYKRVPPGMKPQDAMQLNGESDPAVSAAISAWLENLQR